MAYRIESGGREVEVTSPDKVLFPDGGVTKRDLCDYYARVAPTMMPHVDGRIVSMQRFPDGLGEKSFYQKSVPDYFPDWIATTEVDKEEGSLEQVVIDQPATLVYLANQATITPHCWLSRADDRDRPDRLVFDLDPSGDAGFEEVRWTARVVRELLEEVELTPFVATTGSRGVHVVAPLEPRASFDRARTVARELAAELARRHPERLTVEMRKADRGDRIFLDYLRNGYAQTAVAPYAVRARPGAPVATPIDWEELGSVGPRSYSLSNLFRRLGQKEDPWATIDRAAGRLGAAVAWLEEAGREVG